MAKEGSSNSFKMIYGYEFDFIEDEIPIVKNPIDKKFNDCEYVIFDLETTGLFAKYNDIIEFGAIKVKNNIVIDKIDFFIKPRKEISEKISSLTHITNEMLQKGFEIEEGLKKIND
jgi:DNA polymerase-3 subunit alpha (Gram-positive type)